MTTLADIKSALRNGPYAWPGGYPLYFVTADGEALSFEAAHAQFRTVVADTLGMSRMNEFRIVGIETNWENPALYCVHTGKRIESAYAED